MTPCQECEQSFVSASAQARQSRCVTEMAGSHVPVGTEIVMATSDPEGWSRELHDPCVLQENDKFQGAVWDVKHPACQPDGVVLFHNSPFSNWFVCNQIRLRHGGRDFSFPTSEHIIMAFKEHLLAGTALEVALDTRTGYHSARESKEAAGRATRGAKDYTWWSHHGMHVLVGTVSCWLKFSQDAGLRRFLLSTQQALLVETAPEDGSWGVEHRERDPALRRRPAHHPSAPLRGQRARQVADDHARVTGSRRRGSGS